MMNMKPGRARDCLKSHILLWGQSQVSGVSQKSVCISMHRKVPVKDQVLGHSERKERTRRTGGTKKASWRR